jgi:hypothetical protein
MSTETVLNRAYIREWMTAKWSVKAVEDNLQAKGLDTLSIEAYLKEFKKQRCAQRQFTGFIWMGTGATLGFVSCIMTLTHAIPALYDVILYGLTGVAVTMAIVGLYYVLED